MENITQTSEPMVCNLAAMSEVERARHQQVIQQFFAHAVETVEELPDGFAFRSDAASFLEAAEFVSLERLCCPFFNFALTFDAASPTFRLSIRGSQEVKAMLRRGFAQMAGAKIG